MKLRIMEIIRILLEKDVSITINEIASNLKVSNKTIRNDFKQVSEVLEAHSLSLIKKAGVGVFIQGDAKAKLAMLAKTRNYKSDKKTLNSSDRKLYILFQLLNQDKIIRIVDLEDELFISRPSVYKDLEKVRFWLSERNIELVHEARKGFYIKSGEKRIRKALFDLFMRCYKQDHLIDLLRRNHINFYSYDQKEELYDVDVEAVKNQLKAYENASDGHFTSEGLRRLTIKYCIALSRIRTGHHATMRQQTIDELQSHKLYSLMTDIMKDLSRTLDLIIDSEEIAYFFGITLGTTTHYEKNKKHVNPDVMTINKIISKEVVEETKRYYKIDDEEAFYHGLLHHLKTVNHKMKYGLDFHNEHLDEIKENCPDSFKIAKHTMSTFGDLYTEELPDEEIAYIALHIASAIERSKKPLKACVIYNHSYSETKLMIEYLQNRYRQVDILNLYPMSMFNESLLDTYDMVITTREINDFDHERVIVLPSILIHRDMRQFETILNDIYEKHNENLLRK